MKKKFPGTVSDTTRKNCKYCRLIRCRLAGMKDKWVSSAYLPADTTIKDKSTYNVGNLNETDLGTMKGQATKNTGVKAIHIDNKTQDTEKDKKKLPKYDPWTIQTIINDIGEKKRNTAFNDLEVSQCSAEY